MRSSAIRGQRRGYSTRMARPCVNQTAREMIDDDIKTIIGEPFWTLPWWSQTDETSVEIHQIVENALDRAFGNVVVPQPPHLEDPRVIDLSVRPVESERGDLVSIIVEGVDITERVDLDRDIRQSEKLHRVTLNNMTDTVLITNEAGEYTYVCPQRPLHLRLHRRRNSRARDDRRSTREEPLRPR